MTSGTPVPGHAGPRVLLATCAAMPDLDHDSDRLREALAARGADVAPAVWDDPAVDWAAADLVVVRSTWDYAIRRDEYLAWADRVAGVTRLENDAAVLRWSTDKTYLRDLAEAGVPVVPTHFLDDPEVTDHPFLDVEHVVKPAVSAGSRDTTRLGPDEADRSRACVRAIHASGRTVMVQPYVDAVDTAGETALVHVEGRLSHTLRKAPLLPPGHDDTAGLFREEDMSVREPSPEEVAVAARVLAAVPTILPGADPLYARVDLLPGPDGPVLLELEMAEPSFFLDLVAPEAAGGVADAVLRRCR